jgi:hypothetical protein
MFGAFVPQFLAENIPNESSISFHNPKTAHSTCHAMKSSSFVTKLGLSIVILQEGGRRLARGRKGAP